VTPRSSLARAAHPRAAMTRRRRAADAPRPRSCSPRPRSCSPRPRSGPPPASPLPDDPRPPCEHDQPIGEQARADRQDREAQQQRLAEARMPCQTPRHQAASLGWPPTTARVRHGRRCRYLAAAVSGSPRRAPEAVRREEIGKSDRLVTSVRTAAGTLARNSGGARCGTESARSGSVARRTRPARPPPQRRGD
jgi:type IV secretory pathway VirB10-like protein